MTTLHISRVTTLTSRGTAGKGSFQEGFEGDHAFVLQLFAGWGLPSMGEHVGEIMEKLVGTFKFKA